MKKLGLSTRVFIGFGLGILLGVIFGEKVLVIKIIGDIFLKLIKMLTVPLVFFSIISGITNLTDVNKLKRVGAKILGMYVITTLLAGFIGLGIAHLINPGIGFQIDSSAIGSYEATAMNSVSDTLLAMVPDNIINAMANTNMMGIIIFCAIFGCAILDVGVWRVLRIDFGRIQNNDLHPIRPQRFQRSGKAAGLVGRLADATQARPIYSGELVLLCFMIQFRAMTRTASASVTISPRGT